MSGAAERTRRRAELEEKKRRLEELRRRSASRAAAGSSPDAGESAAPSPLDGALAGESLGDLLSNLEHVIPASASSSSHASSGVGTPTVGHKDADAGSAASSAAGGADASVVERLGRLSVVRNVSTVSVLPRVVESYSKGTQTVVSVLESRMKASASNTGAEVDLSASVGESGASSLDLRRSFSSPESDAAQVKQQPHQAETQNKDNNGTAQKQLAAELDPAEIARIETSAEFQQFLQQSTVHIERALELGSKYDIFVDYSDTTSLNEGISDVSDVSVSATHVLSYEHCFHDARLCRGRSVSDVAWSTAHRDLFLAAYGAPASEQTALDALSADGLVLLWSLTHGTLSGAPEYVLSCPSAVTAATFSSNLGAAGGHELVVGACYSGQVVLWDTRTKGGSGRALNPVQASPLSGTAHTQPIFSIISSGNGRLTTVSTDARVCVWSLENLLAPIEVRDLRGAGGAVGTNENAEIYGVLSADIPSFDKGRALAGSAFDDKTILGCEDGSLLVGDKKHSKLPSTPMSPATPSKPSGDQRSVFRLGSHFGPVQSVHAHPWARLQAKQEQSVSTQSDFGRLILSASSDWSCGVFDCEAGDSHDAIMRLDHSAAVYDARWSPTHPSVFSSVDETGVVTLWNLAQDSDTPVSTLSVASHQSDTAPSSRTQGQAPTHSRTKSDAGDTPISGTPSRATSVSHPDARALSRVRWSNDGRLLAVGDAGGRVHTVQVGHSYAPGSQFSDEVHAFDDAIIALSD